MQLQVNANVAKMHVFSFVDFFCVQIIELYAVKLCCDPQVEMTTGEFAELVLL